MIDPKAQLIADKLLPYCEVTSVRINGDRDLYEVDHFGMRRFSPGPTTITAVIEVLVVDEAFFRESPYATGVQQPALGETSPALEADT